MAGASDRRRTNGRDIGGVAERTAWRVVADQINTGEYFDGAVLHDVVDLMPAEGALFVGNSLPVRQLDQFGLARASSLSLPTLIGARPALTAMSQPRSGLAPRGAAGHWLPC